MPIAVSNINLQSIDTKYGSFSIPKKSDLICNSLREYGEWAQNEINLLCALLKAGDTALDIGACFGTHTRAFSTVVGQTGKVLSIEANPETFKVLTHNIELAPLNNIFPFNFGASQSSGQVLTFDTPKQNIGATKAYISAITTPEQYVKTIAVDDLDLNKLDLIKIDVEGMEVNVLNGAKKHISQFRPSVFCEVNSVTDGINILSAWQMNDYEIIGVCAAAFNPSSHRLSTNNMFGDASECGVLFLPKERTNLLPRQIPYVSILEIKGIEDMVRLMLGKKQYIKKLTASIYGNNFQTFSPPVTDETLTLDQQLSSLQEENAALKQNMRELSMILTKNLRSPARPLLDYLKHKSAKIISRVSKPISEKTSIKFRNSAIKRDPKRFSPAGALAIGSKGLSIFNEINPSSYEEPKDRGGLIKKNEPTEYEWSNLELRGGIVASDPLVDVIMPVYKGYAETLRSIYSVLSQYQVTPFRLIVINDRSPITKLTNKLLELERRGLIELLSNENNLGFVDTCNIGINMHKNRDIVLLNSDTEVYGDWLDRLCSHACKPDVGTITPLSNNATICSYPFFNQDNTKQLEIDHKSIDDIASAHLKGQSVHTPTGVGFCLFIKRDCISKVGLLDSQSFGKGYGEENDFCCRAINSGFINLIAADVFVTHWGSCSFGESKSKLIENAMSKLRRLHPSYFGAVESFIRRDPLLVYRREIDIQRLKHRISNKKRGAILFITHGRGGGTEVHTNFLAEKLESQGSAVLYCKPHPLYVNKVCIFDKQSGPMPNLPLFDFNYSSLELSALIQKIGITHIHIHHTIDMSVSAPFFIKNVANIAGIRYDFTAHDYFSICPRINLIGHSGYYCGEPNVTACNECLKHDSSFAIEQDISSWRSQYHSLLASARRVFAPDVDVANRLQKYFPDINFTVRPHEFNFNKKDRCVSNSRNNRRRIGLIGALGTCKGSSLIAPVAKAALRLGLDMDFVVIGYTNCDSELQLLPNVRITGKYPENSIQEIIASENLSLAWFPSVWPETFCYTLSEAMSAGVYPVAFDLGAPARRIRACGWGGIMDLELSLDPNKIAQFLHDVEITARPENLYSTYENTRYENILSDYYEL